MKSGIIVRLHLRFRYDVASDGDSFTLSKVQRSTRGEMESGIIVRLHLRFRYDVASDGDSFALSKVQRSTRGEMGYIFLNGANPVEKDMVRLRGLEPRTP